MGFPSTEVGGRFTTLVPSPLFNLIRFETLHPPLQKKSKNGDDFEAILPGEQCRIQDFLLKWANWYHTYKRISDWTKGKFGDPSIHPMTGPWNWHIYLHEWLVFVVNVRKYPIHGSYGYYIGFSRIWIVRHTIPRFAIAPWCLRHPSLPCIGGGLTEKYMAQNPCFGFIKTRMSSI